MSSRRRLGENFGPRHLRYAERRLRAVEEWAARFKGWFPPDLGNAFEHWHLSIDRRLVDSPTARVEHQARCAQALLDAARNLVEARPKDRTHHRVAALIPWPKMFMSQVDVFIDEEYFQNFETRHDEYQQWTPLPPERSLARELGLVFPECFAERGYRELIIEPGENGTEGEVFEGEVWIVGERPISR